MARLKLTWLTPLLATPLLISSEPRLNRPYGLDTTSSDLKVLQDHLAESLETWKWLKVKYGDSYRYEVHGGFLSFYDVTTIKVQNGRVVARAYTYFERNAKDKWEFLDEYSWTEEGAAVGSHKDEVAPQTVDEVYKVCRDDVLTQDPRMNTISLVIDGDGLLSQCNYYTNAKNVVVDVAPGVSISGLEFLPKPAPNRR